MSTSDFDSGSSVIGEEEEDEEGKLYQWIYEMNYKDDKEDREEVQSPSRSEQKLEHMTDDERSTHETGSSSRAVSENKRRERRPKPHSHTRRNHKEAEYPQETPALREKTERKPWREPGADITDYFNYGFDEESWNSYRKKHTKLHAANKKQNAKSKVQKGHYTHEDREPGCASSPSSYPSSTVAHRRPHVLRVPSWLCSEDEQVHHERFPEEDGISSHILRSSSPPDNSCHPPSRVPFRRRPHRHRHRTPDSENSEHLVGSTSMNPSPSGVTPLIPKKRAHSSEVNKSAKAREHFMRREKCEDERRYYDRYKKRHKDRERENISSACSRKEHQRHRKTTKPEQRQETLESLSGEKEGREERRQREKQDGREKSSHSGSSRRREPGEVRDSHRPKKKKRKNKNKEKKKTFTADRERKLQSE